MSHCGTYSVAVFHIDRGYEQERHTHSVAGAPFALITCGSSSPVARHFASRIMPRKRSHTDVVETTQGHFCHRCQLHFQRGGGPSHLRTCVAAQAAQQYQRSLEAHCFNDDSYTTPTPANRTENTSSHSADAGESDQLVEDTTENNAPQIVVYDNNDEGSDTVTTNITTYLASLPASWFGHGIHSTM
jgi:hypothetical protein